MRIVLAYLFLAAVAVPLKRSYSSVAVSQEQRLRDTNDIADIEAHILASRRAIRSGQFAVQVTSDDNREWGLTYRTWIASDGEIRQERTYREELQVSIFAKDFAYYYAARPGRFKDPDLTHRPPIERIPIAQARPDKSPHLICNPLVLMFAPVRFGLLPHHGLESLVNARGRVDLHANATTWNGVPAVTVHFVLSKTGDSFEYDVVPSRGYNIVRWRQKATVHPKRGGEFHFDNSISCGLAQIGPSQWFPDHIDLVNTWDGKPTLAESLAVVASHLNEEIPANVFSLAADKLPPKQLVLQQPFYNFSHSKSPATMPSRALIWDGGQLRPLTARDEVERRLSHEAGGQATSYSPANGQATSHSPYPKWLVPLLALIGLSAIALWIGRNVTPRQSATRE